MLLLSAVLIAAISNLDNLAVGIAFGMRDKRIAATPNMIIAAVTMAGTAAAITSGQVLSHLLPSSVASTLGSSIIIAIGAGTLVASVNTLLGRSRAPLPQGTRRGRDHHESNGVSYREALVFGVALSLNNVGSGVGAGAAGIPPLTTTLLAGAFSLLCVGCGSRAGCSAGRHLLRGHASLVAGLVLLAVGGATLTGAG